MTPLVEITRPFAYLCAAGALALGSFLLPDGGAAAPPAAAPTTTAPAAPAAAPCTEVQDSLRPRGPLPAPGAMPAGSTMARIAERGVLVAGVDQGKYNTAYRDPETGDLQGSDIDLARSIAAALLGDPNKVRLVVLDVADREKALQRGDVDVVVNTFTVTCERQRNIAFSSPYLTATQRLLVAEGSGIKEVEDLRGQRVCTSKGSTTERVLRELPVGLDVQTLRGIPDCMLELQAGRAAAVSSDDVILAGLAAQDPQTEVVGRALDRASYGVGMRRDAEDLVRFVNAVLERGRADGSLEASDRRWFGATLNPVPQPPPAAYRD